MLLTEGKETSKHAGLTYKKGQILQRFEYSPFGGEIYALNPNLKFDPSYTGQRYDIETGLYYYQSRYYDPMLGRFIQPDTVIQDGKDLQAYNRYAYVRNNPLKYVDPSGHFWGWFKKYLGAFIGALITAALFAAMAMGVAPAGVGLMAAIKALSLGQMVAFGALSGLVGGLVGGAISGGAKGALIGAAMGFAGGALSGGAFYGLGHALNNFTAAGAILAGVGASISAGTGGWRGLVLFGAGLAGAYVGGKIGESWGIKIQMAKAAGAGMGNSALEGSNGKMYADATIYPEDSTGCAHGSGCVGGGGGGRITEGTKVYRVWGDKSGPYGESWTTADPSMVPNYRSGAGLPTQNSGRFVSEGVIKDPSGITTRQSLPLGNNPGRIVPEVVIPNPGTQVDLHNVSGVNPPY